MAVSAHVPTQPPASAEPADTRPETTGARTPRGRGPVSVSVIIPALNEATTLPACLRSLLAQDYDGAMRVIVVDNGSIDGTVLVARRWAADFAAAGHEMLVLQIEKANKCAALNAGDAHAAEGCRIYLDADTEVSPNCVSSVAAALADGSGVQMCCPRMHVARSRSWVTRRYARVWTGLPWVAGDAIGGGFYAVSAAGRRRWGHFPDLLAEDAFVQAQFRLCERRVLPEATFVVRLPDGFANVLKVRTRWVSGNRQLARQVSGEWGRAAFPFAGRIKSLLARPGLWPDLPLYLLINFCALRRARRREPLGTRIWERARPFPQPESLEDSEIAPWSPGS